ncbi:MAG: NHL repeat-containing protein, partial [Limisphaerales bacterium]
MKRILQLLIGFLAGGLFAMTSALGQASYTTPYTFTTIAGATNGDTGSADGTNNAAQFYWPENITVDSATNLYVADTFNDTIRKMTLVGTNWVVTTIAGAAQSAGYADGTNLAAQFNFPFAIAVDTNGNLYVADTYNETIRKLTPVGTNWVVSTIAGTAENSGNTDGTNLAAQFYSPSGITMDPNGNLYVADTYNETIRKLTPVGTNWVVSTIAGSETGDYGSADGTNRSALFYNPASITVDGQGNLYVVDSGGDLIRELRPVGTNWVVSTIAGTAGNPGSADGTNLTAQFYDPFGISADRAGNLYVADTDNYTIRKLTPIGTNWVTTTLAGLAGSVGSADGTGTNALFNFPFGVTVDRAGNLYVADTENSTIRMGKFVSTTTPNLAITFESPNSVVISWPDLGGFTLQTNGDLKTTNWVNY